MNSGVVNVKSNWVQNDVQQSTLVQKTSKWKWILLNVSALTLITIAFCALPLLWVLNVEINTLTLIGFSAVFIGLLSVIACSENMLKQNEKL